MTRQRIEGMPVVDATRPLTLHITPRDIEISIKREPTSCAAAAACLRQFDIVAARVHLTRTLLQINGRWVRYITPRTLRQEIITFDRGGVFEPGDFTLKPAPVREDRPTGTRAVTGKKRHLTHAVANVRPTLRAKR